MNLLFVFLQAGGGGDYSFLIMMVAIFAIFRKNLEVGQEVITAGGIYGKIKEIEDNTVVLEIASGVKIKIDRNSIFANAASNQQQAK